ncbi:site-specific DNA-methyltransferase [Maricaulis sp.]|uniref:site-specific DNA-methyltransferase n=1 Tax=Maricaulis sp. TaxID=1486257 RepID=UPI003A9357F1
MVGDPSVVEFETAALVDYERNARKHSKAQLAALVRAISRFGFNAPIAVWRDGMILAGHGRVAAARQLGLARLPGVDLSGLAFDEARAFCLADNRIADMARWEEQTLRSELSDLAAEGVSIDDLGWSARELEGLLAGGADPDLGLPHGGASAPASASIPALAESVDALIGPTMVERGEVWRFGDHVLICGDSTDPAVIARIAPAGSIDLLLTDPPYGVDYAGKQAAMNKVSGGKANAAVIANDELSGGNLRAFIGDAFMAAFPALKPGAGVYAFSAPGSDGQMGVMLGMVDAGLPPRHGLIWVKNSIVLSRADVNYQHEALHYGWKPGADPAWFGPVPEEAMWVCDRPSVSKAHPTMKPPALLERALRNSTRPGALVLDIFGGSGSTLVAAHRLGRRAALVELDEQFASVICRRARHELGLEPVRDDGLTFSQKEAAAAA